MLDRDHYLLEAKWTKDLVNLGDLRDLDGAVGSSLDNTLGLFISVEGFSKEGITGLSRDWQNKDSVQKGQAPR